MEARDRATADIRRSLARDLHDVVAQDLAVLAMQTQAIRVAFDRAAQQRMADAVADVDLQVQEQDGVRAPRHVDATVHRIAHEAVTNVLKHAPAGGACQVLFTLSPGQVRLRVLSELSPAQHPGRPRDAPQPDGSFGVLNIRERAGLAGGRADVGPREGRWHVDVGIPFGVPA